MQFVNQYSFTILAGLILILFTVVSFRRGVGQRPMTALVALALGFLLAYGFFNPGEGSIGGVQRARTAIGSGTPVLLELQSPY
ncbi:MAG: hypothetical protein E4G99_00355 [Anaerolineales bacterium]|nr:MAG: hypothetical protein E4G99_00355 [Anaerolineales bacterium]